LEQIYDDFEELKEVHKRLKPNGKLIIVVPAHQKIYGKLDKEVGHYRRYEKQFFKKEIYSLRRVNIKFVDSIGYILYLLNNIFFREEKFPSIYKIFSCINSYNLNRLFSDESLYLAYSAAVIKNNKIKRLYK